MSDFTQTMKEWTRMCRSHNDEPDPCELCKLGHNGELCMAVFEAADVGEPDYAHIENVVARWAEEHPEPQYPTWLEWLESIGVMEDATPTMESLTRNLELFGRPIRSIPSEKIFEPIPDDIAKKLGIQPKEG